MEEIEGWGWRGVVGSVTNLKKGGRSGISRKRGIYIDKNPHLGPGLQK